MNRKNNNKKVMVMLLMLCMSLFTFTSCDYREHADADYPESTVYQPLAADVLVIDAKTNISKVEVPTPGTPTIFEVNKTAGKLVLKMGVVQAGINLLSADVNLRADINAVQEAQTAGTISEDAVILPSEAYSLPSSLKVKGASTPYELSVSLDAIKAHPGKMVALAVTLTSSNINVSETLATQLVLIDADFIIAQ